MSAVLKEISQNGVLELGTLRYTFRLTSIGANKVHPACQKRNGILPHTWAPVVRNVLAELSLSLYLVSLKVTDIWPAVALGDC